MFSFSSKLSLRKLALLSSNTLRTFASTTTTNPYLMCRSLGYGLKDDINTTLDIHYFDPVQEDEVIVQGKAYPMELRQGYLAGMSHGWGVFTVKCGDNDKETAVYVTDFLNPCGSKSNPKTILLHKMFGLFGTQVDVITNAAMTSSPDQSKDFAVAVKCLGRQVNFSRPGGKHENSALDIAQTPFDYFDQSKIMYSKKDEKFYIPSFAGNFLGSLDSFFEESNPLYKLHELRFCNLPQLTQSEWELLDSCSMTAHFVESPSGQRFLIKWYAQNYQPEKQITFLCRGTKRFMVFKEEEDMNMCYTEDIGDLCIFLGKNDPFCVKASSFPGLNPNSIYFAGDGFGFYDIATRKPRSFHPKTPSAFSTPPLPYWIPPMSPNS